MQIIELKKYITSNNLFYKVYFKINIGFYFCLIYIELVEIALNSYDQKNKINLCIIKKIYLAKIYIFF